MEDRRNQKYGKPALNRLRKRMHDAFKVAEACVNNVGVDLRSKCLFSPFTGEVLWPPDDECYCETSAFMGPFWGGFDADEIIGDAIKYGGVC